MARTLNMNLVESALKGSKLVDTYNSKQEDFLAGDIVKCSYMSNLYEVVGHWHDKVTITKIDYNEDIVQVSPKYLKKETVNREAVRVLYGDK